MSFSKGSVAPKKANRPPRDPALHARVVAERRAQGLPDYIEDPECLRRIAQLLAEPSGGQR